MLFKHWRRFISWFFVIFVYKEDSRFVLVHSEILVEKLTFKCLNLRIYSERQLENVRKTFYELQSRSRFMKGTSKLG